MTRFTLILSIAAIVTFSGCHANPAVCTGQPSVPVLKRFEYTQPKWGAAARIVLYAPDEASAKRASDAAFARFDELGKSFNDYDPESEISRLSLRTLSGPMAEPVKISPDLFAIFQHS